MKLISIIRASLCLLVLAFAPNLPGGPLGTAFTYQGRLQQSGGEANGLFDFQFSLWDNSALGTLIGAPQTVNAVSVTNGLFTASLDFGSVFNGNALWLQISVRSNSAPTFSPLTPRQALNPAPYANYAPSAGSAGVATLANTVAPASITSASLAPGAVFQLSSPGGGIPGALQVDTNGWVGIGTNIPQAALEIAGGAPIVGLRVLSEVLDGVGSFTNLASAFGVAVSTNLLAVAGYSDNAVTLVDAGGSTLSFRSSIQQGQGSFTNLQGAQSLAFTTNNLLAVAAYIGSAVTLIDASNPASPVWKAVLRTGVGGWNDLNGASAVAFKANLLAIAAQNANAVTLADVSNPAAPVQRVVLRNGTFGFNALGGPNAVAFAGNLLAISAVNSNAVTLVNVANPASPTLMSVLNTASGFPHLISPWAVVFDGNLLAIAAYGSSAVTLADVSNPAAPSLRAVIRNGVGGINQFAAPWGLAFLHQNGRTLLVVGAYGSSSLSVFDVTDPTRPLLRGQFTSGQVGLHYMGTPAGLAFNASGQLAVAAISSSALSLVSFTDQQTGLASDTWVGIGTTTPAAALNVVGDVLVENASRFQVQATRIEFGISTVATGAGSTAMGESTTASGADATALGYGTTASGLDSVAMGQNSTAAGLFSLAAGRRAKAMHAGTFVWADQQNADFSSTAANQFLIRASGGVGVNKTNPAAALDVSGTVAATAVGIGTTTPTDGILDVEGDTHINDFDLFLRANSDQNHGLGWYGAGKTFAGLSLDGPVLYGCAGGGLGTLCGSGPRASLSWDSNGRLAVDPGNLNSGTVSSASLTFGAGSGEGIASKRTAGGNQYALDFYTGGVNRMSIFSSGRVSIGGTNAEHVLDVNGNAAMRGSLLVNSKDQQDGSYPELPGILFGDYDSGEVISSQRGTNGPNRYGLDLYTGFARRISVANNGNVGIGRQPTANRLEVAGNASKDVAGSWLANSDARIKQDIQPVTGALEKLDKVRLVSFRYTDEYRRTHPGAEEHPYVNVIAQEFREVFPEDVKSSGERLADGSEILQVDSYPLTIYSAAAVQELNRKLETQLKVKEAEIGALKQRLDRLERLLENAQGH